MLVALLGWFDEEPALLKQCVKSLNGPVDHLIAVDGAYRLFPGARPSSPPDQAEAIREAAEMPVTVVAPDEPWENQLAKRRAMFEEGEKATTEEDFFLVIDADETLDPGFSKAELANVDLVGRMDFTDDFVSDEGQVTEAVRRVMRARRGIALGPAHGDYRLPDGTWLQCTDDKSLQVEAYQFSTGMTHHRTRRPAERIKRQTEFYKARVRSDEELQQCEACGCPATKRVWTDWRRIKGETQGRAGEFCALHAWKEHNRSLTLAERLGVRKQVREAGLL